MTGAAPAVAMVFAAGRGKRMRPLSDAVPKPALDLPDGPVIASSLRLAVEAGCGRVVVNAWHLADRIEAAVTDSGQPPGVGIRVSREPALMGTAGGLALARDRGLLGDDGPVLVLNGDGLLSLSLEPLLLRHGAGQDLVTLGLLPHLDPFRWSRVLLDDDGLVRDIRPPGRPDGSEVPFLYPGVMVVARAALDGLQTRPHGVGEGLWAPAREAGGLGGVVVTGHWREVGTPSDYLEAALRQLRDEARIHPSARVHRGASIGTAFVGPHARVEAGAVLGDCVVTEGAIVRRDARVIRSVLLGAVEASPGEYVVDEFRAPPRAH